MDRHDVQTGILSLSTPGVYFGDAVETRQRAREVNEYSAEVVAGRPERFGFFATLTLPDVEGALAEARTPWTPCSRTESCCWPTMTAATWAIRALSLCWSFCTTAGP